MYLHTQCPSSVSKSPVLQHPWLLILQLNTKARYCGRIPSSGLFPIGRQAVKEASVCDRYLAKSIINDNIF